MYEPSDPPIHPFSRERQSTSVISYPSSSNQAVELLILQIIQSFFLSLLEGLERAFG